MISGSSNNDINIFCDFQANNKNIKYIFVVYIWFYYFFIFKINLKALAK